MIASPRRPSRRRRWFHKFILLKPIQACSTRVCKSLGTWGNGHLLTPPMIENIGERLHEERGESNWQKGFLRLYPLPPINQFHGTRL